MTTLVATFVGAACCRTAFAQIPPPQILRWEIQATVIQIDEPVGVLNEVRLGDPVRGSLTFHRSVVPDGGFYNSYTHPATFAVTRMIVDNPRTGGEMVFEPAKDYSAYHNIDVYNDKEDYYDEELIVDYIIALDDVVAPDGLDVDYPVTAIELTGRPTFCRIPTSRWTSIWRIGRRQF